MKIKYLSLIPSLTAIAIVLGTTPAGGESPLSSEKTFTCQTEADTPVTLAKTSNGEMQPIFHWNSSALPDDADGKQLCQDVSQQLDNYFTSEHDFSFIGFKGTSLENLPTVCLTGQENECQLVLFTLSPSEKPVQVANLALDSILDPQLQSDKIAYRDRGVQSYYYRVNFWSLLGLKFIK
ncbi:MAG: hypothetical protein Tsb0014_08100 [Pleurocapsa sp.]